MNRRDLLAAAGGAALAGLSAPLALARTVESAAWRLSWPDLGRDWTDGLPIANGQLGGLLWVKGEEAALSIDRADLWDLRATPEFQSADFTYANLNRLRLAGAAAEITRRFEDPFHRPGAGKLPLGRLRFGLPATRIRQSRLDLQRACAALVLEDQTVVTAWVCAEANIGVLRFSGASAQDLARATRVEAPAYGQTPNPNRKKESPLDYGGPEDLGYAPIEDLARPGQTGYATQSPAEGFAVATLYLSLSPSESVVLWTIGVGADSASAARSARQTLNAVSSRRLPQLEAEHLGWWARFWAKADVSTGDAALDQRWRLSTYHLGAAARDNGPPVPLQAPWTWDNGRLPAWKGDYHHDLNTEMTYWPVYAGNRPEASRNLVDWLWATRDQARAYSRSFFGVDGIAMPGTTDILGRPLGGWAAYSFPPTASAWLLHHFDLHWQYFGDAKFVEERAYPYAKGVTQLLKGLLKPKAGRDGLFLPATISPEINDNRLNSWFDDWTNFDLALVRYAFTCAGRMARAIGKAAEAEQHQAMLAQLPAFALDEDGGFAIAPGTPVAASHRHFSHLIAFYPLRLLDPQSDPQAKRALDASLRRLDRLGTKAWMGYSFAWYASLQALRGDGAKARQGLQTFERGFSGRNGFHTNGDRSGTGITAFPFSLFTLEGGQAACAAVQELLIQGCENEVVLFPADLGPTARFHGLRAAPGLDVSATLRDGKVVALELRSQRRLRIKVTGPGLPTRDIVVNPAKPWRFASG